MELDSIYDNILESYINDYTIFEAVLRRDYYQSTGLLTEEADRNFVQVMWDKLIELINAAKHKVISIVDSVINKSHDKTLEKYKKMVEDNKELLNKTDFSNFTCDFKSIDWSKDEDGNNSFKNLCDTFSVQLNWSINDLRTRDIDDIIKTYTDSVKDGKKINEDFYKKFVIDHKGSKLSAEWVKPENLIKDLNGMVDHLKYFREYKLKVLKHFESLQKEVTQLKRDAKKSKNDEELKFANKAHKAFSIVLKDILGTFKIINRLITTDMKGQIKLIKSAVSFAKEQNKKSQNASYLYDIDYINAVTEAEIYELEL